MSLLFIFPYLGLFSLVPFRFIEYLVIVTPIIALTTIIVIKNKYVKVFLLFLLILIIFNHNYLPQAKLISLQEKEGMDFIKNNTESDALIITQPIQRYLVSFFTKRDIYEGGGWRYDERYANLKLLLIEGHKEDYDG